MQDWSHYGSNGLYDLLCRLGSLLYRHLGLHYWVYGSMGV